MLICTILNPDRQFVGVITQDGADEYTIYLNNVLEGTLEATYGNDKSLIEVAIKQFKELKGLIVLYSPEALGEGWK